MYKEDENIYMYGSVTKDQSGWGFNVKQDATTIRDDSSASGPNVQLNNGNWI